MKKLENILESVKLLESKADSMKTIAGVSVDSRQVKKDFLFIAYKGYRSDGHAYIGDAEQKGAHIIVFDDPAYTESISVNWVRVKDARKASGIIAANFYGHPSQQMKVIGITGTNGKTTVATLLHGLYRELGYKAGLISTIRVKLGKKTLDSSLTTPDPVSLQALFAEMLEKGLEFVFMEASSHALDQGRTDEVDFDGAIFTNASRDHLDYHKNFRDYLKAKKKLFDGLRKDAVVLVNRDDKNGGFMVQNCKASVHDYALKSAAEFKGKVVGNNINGLQLDIDGREVYMKMIGYFNAYNILAVYGMAVLLGEDPTRVLSVLSSLNAAEGRLDMVRGERNEFTAIIDYAHTPDALENVLSTLSKVKDKDSKIITVVGCGGNRDKGKRPVMGRIAAKYSQKVILTSDNPRDEDPEKIIDEMMEGIGEDKRNEVIRMADRREAIKLACNMAGKSDLVLVAGKGHEKYQEIKGQRVPLFDDKKILSALMH